MPPTKGIVRPRYDWRSDSRPLETELLDRALTRMGLASWRFDVATSRLAGTSAQLESLLGQPPGESQNASSLWQFVIHPADRAWLVAYRELMLGDPLADGYECSYRALMLDGRERWLREVVQVERDAQRQALVLAGILENITQRREQEEKRAEGAERFRAAFEDAFNGIAMVGIDGKFLEVNREFAHIAGVSVATILEMSLEDFEHPDDAESAMDPAAQIDGEGPLRRDRRYVRPNGVIRWVIETATLIYDAEARPSYFVVQALDVTDRRDADAALKSAEAQLLQAQKMEALGLLAGGVAHDFNNLLTVIKSYSQMVIDTLEQTDPNHEDLTEVVSAADRATTLTRQLLAFSRKQAQHWQSLRIDMIVSETERMLQRLIGTAAELVVDGSSEVGEVEADKGQIEQVIMNLVVNARDAMPRGGRITITTRDVELLEPLSNTIPSVVPAGRYVMLEVRDSGTGMDDSTIARIFEPFFTTKAAGHGTGLGLSTVYGIIQQCGGHLAVSSELGRGSEFRVYLPRRGEYSLAIEASTERELVRGTETVLVIEDDEAVRTLTRHILVRLGYSVLAARDAKDAIQIAAAFDQDIQLLLCDVQLPGDSGYRAAEQITATRRESRVLFMSGHTDVAANAGESSAVVEKYQRLDLLAKPFSLVQLSHAVRDALDASGVPVSRNDGVTA